MRYPFGGLVRPGKTAVLRQVLDACAGEFRERFSESRRRIGVTRENVWIIATPIGDVVVGFFEADDPDATTWLHYSDDEFDQWFIDQVADVLAPPAEPMPEERIYSFEWKDDESAD